VCGYPWRSHVGLVTRIGNFPFHLHLVVTFHPVVKEKGSSALSLNCTAKTYGIGDIFKYNFCFLLE
jgi:hypothetical protein